MRYLITFSYDGTKFHGFQRQKNVRSVQGVLEKCLSDYFKEKIVVKGSGRTDAFVHANGQCAHFDVSKKIMDEDIDNLNEILNGDIFIKDIVLVSDEFHARFSVKEKVYVYKINNGIKNDDMNGYYYQIPYELDFEKMKLVCEILKGTHDFHNFVSGYRDNYISTIYDIDINKYEDIITITFRGIGFYRYMVRHLVGAIIDVGRGKANLDEVMSMLNNPDVFKNLAVVPAEGLYLDKVIY